MTDSNVPSETPRYRRYDKAGTANAAAKEETVLPVEFEGNASEWFGIWIVNILFTILTLGIYSAWAKVRTKRYFYGNTFIDGHAFNYHAEPIQILKGRIAVVLFLIVMNLSAEFVPFLAPVVLLIYLVIIPWAVVRGTAFNARMTSWRNVRFGFTGRKRDVLLAYIFWPFMAFLSSGLLAPFASRSIMRFQAGYTAERGHAFGKAGFSTNVGTGPYYRGVLYSIGFFVAAIVLFVSGAAAITGAIGAAQTETTLGVSLFTALTLGVTILFAFGYFVYSVVARNVNYNHLELEGGHRFHSDIKTAPFLWIMVTNFFAMIVSLGLLIPWAQIRKARYLAAHTFILPAGDLDQFASAVQPEGGVASGEFLDMEGMDLGF